MFSEIAGATIPFFVHDEGSPISELSDIRISNETAIRLREALETFDMTDGEYGRYMRTKNKQTQSSQNESPNSLEKRIIKAMQDWQEAETGERPSYRSLREKYCFKYHTVLDRYDDDETNYFRFVHPRMVKLIAMQSDCLNPRSKQDANRGRYSGLLQSRIRTLLLYSLRKPKFGWPHISGDAELSADKAWKKIISSLWQSLRMVQGSAIFISRQQTQNPPYSTLFGAQSAVLDFRRQ